jgi:putative oxidoreductase
MPATWATLIALIEFFGGLCLALGLFTRPVAIAIFIFLVNAALFHSAFGFFWTDKGFEYPMLWAVAALFFAIKGGGPLSLDRKIGREL